MLSLLQASAVRRKRTLLTAAALLVVFGFLFLARGALTPFFLGLVLAYLLLPLVRWLERFFPFPEAHRRWAHVCALALVYVCALALLALAIALALPAAFRQVSHFFELLPATVAQAQEVLAIWTAEYRANVPPEIQSRIDETAASIIQNAGNNAQEAAMHTITAVSQTFSILLGFFAIPVWLFYVLKDQQQAKAWFYQLVPTEARTDVEALFSLVDRVLASYVRAQLLLGLLVGLMTGISLFLLDVRFALVLGIIAGITELIPVLGPILGAIPAILVTLANAPEKVVWVILLFVAVQAAENNLLVPRIQGHAVKIHPAIIMVLLILASEVAGLVGMIVAVPAAAVCRDVFLYLYRRFGAEEQAYSS